MAIFDSTEKNVRSIGFLMERPAIKRRDGKKNFKMQV